MIYETPTERYLSSGEVQHQTGYADVTTDLLGSWFRAGHLPRVTAGELAAVLGREAPPDPDRHIQVAGPSGDEFVYRWSDVVRVETRTRLTRRRRGGRARRPTPPASRAA